jgi:pyridoxine 5'-phosphate synthase PdxJ
MHLTVHDVRHWDDGLAKEISTNNISILQNTSHTQTSLEGCRVTDSLLECCRVYRPAPQLLMPRSISHLMSSLGLDMAAWRLLVLLRCCCSSWATMSRTHNLMLELVQPWPTSVP